MDFVDDAVPDPQFMATNAEAMAEAFGLDSIPSYDYPMRMDLIDSYQKANKALLEKARTESGYDLTTIEGVAVITFNGKIYVPEGSPPRSPLIFFSVSEIKISPIFVLIISISGR